MTRLTLTAHNNNNNIVSSKHCSETSIFDKSTLCIYIRNPCLCSQNTIARITKFVSVCICIRRNVNYVRVSKAIQQSN